MTKDIQSRTDEELYGLMHGASEEAHSAFEELYSRHASRVYTYCRRMMNSDTLAEDIFQETFIRFYNSARSERLMTNVAAYLLRIARNLCLNEKQRKHHNTVTFEELHFPSYHTPYESTELLRLVEMAMEMLPEEYREVLILKEHLGFSYNEIADVTATTMPVVRMRIYRAKTKIREILAPYLEDVQK